MRTKALQEAGHYVIIAGDFNIKHQDIDIANFEDDLPDEVIIILIQYYLLKKKIKYYVRNYSGADQPPDPRCNDCCST